MANNENMFNSSGLIVDTGTIEFINIPLHINILCIYIPAGVGMK